MEDEKKGTKYIEMLICYDDGNDVREFKIDRLMGDISLCTIDNETMLELLTKLELDALPGLKFEDSRKGASRPKRS